MHLYAFMKISMDFRRKTVKYAENMQMHTNPGPGIEC